MQRNNQHNKENKGFNFNKPNIETKPDIETRQNIETKPQTGKIILHPLHRIFSAEHYEPMDHGLNIAFYNCYIQNRFFYPRIEWDIDKHILRLYRNNGKMEIKCIETSVSNCYRVFQ